MSTAEAEVAGTTTDRIKAFLNPPATETPTNEPKPKPPVEQVSTEQAGPKASEQQTVDRKAPAAEEDGDEPTLEVADDDDEVQTDVADDDDAQDVDVQLSTLDELADATGLERDKLLDLSLPVKIDGKEGTARIRDLLKSYQLDGHINQKLESLNTDRKTFETKRQESERAAADRLLKLDSGVQTLERALMGEFAAVDWQALQSQDPAGYNSKFVSYQQRYAQLQDIARQIAEEKQQANTANQARAKAWLEEQRTLLKAKIPEWSDDTRRAKDKAEILDYLKGHGIGKEEFEQLADHRYALVIRDAQKWAALQKGKPSVLKRLKAAPKLLKPGTEQSRAAKQGLAVKGDREKLRRSGKVSDAATMIKRLGIV